MKGYTYILKCADGSFYTGSTKNIEQRFYQHQHGEGANHTKRRLPVKLVFVEEFGRIDEAYQREKQVQGWSRKKKQALIEGAWGKLKEYAQCQNASHCLAFAFDFAQATLDSAQVADSTQAALAPTDTTPSLTDNTPSLTDTTPSLTDNTPSLTDNTPSFPERSRGEK